MGWPAWTAEQRKAANDRRNAWRRANPEKMRAESKRYREKNKDKYAAKQRAYRLRNLTELNEKARARQERKRAQFPFKARSQQMKSVYGITLEDYGHLLKMQGGLCAICLQPETVVRKGRVTSLSIDHCHKTGRVRGLLCSACNFAVGKFADDPNRAERAARYLRGEIQWQA